MPVLRSFSGHFPVTGTAALTSQIEPALSITQIQGDPLSFIAIDVERVKTELLTYNTTDAVLARKQAILAQALRMVGDVVSA